ncbi:putative transcription factor cys6 protein [Botrytis fragariae]|uniref:Putative transcription factor cys6 protein n=1 Tax=Botrytis fragariae TaxID=1964551 RepID=A0A8H6B1G0_9HELO|nr:putative transcription factor cys6 protein [Botrytis fragariae]KAF5877644.1 putative transcription factor cys6 protein [Botrytis fragariae]
MSTGNQMPTFNTFTITQPFLGAPLQFQPALGSRELEELIDAYVVGDACKQDKLSTVTIDFYNHATVDINTGSLVRRYDVMPWTFGQSPSQSQSSGLSPPIFTPSPASSAIFADSAYSSMSTPPNRTRGSRVTKKTKKDTTKKSAEVRLPGFSIMTKDGIDVTNSAGRGTKTKEQREHAHLMRIIKACDECKRKKIRCDPSHRRASHTNTPRTSTSSRPSPPSQSNPSPAASTPSLSRETTQGSEQSSPPVDSFSIEDFVLFPEDELNQWNPEMAIPDFDTQYNDFSMTNYENFPDFDTGFSTMNDNISFDFPVYDQSSSFSPQLLNNTSHLLNYHNTQPLGSTDVNSQYISQTQPQPDLDFFESFSNIPNFSPTHTQQAHPQGLPNEDPGKIDSYVHAPTARSQTHNISSVLSTANTQTSGANILNDLSTTFGFSPTDSSYQSQGSENGFVSTGPDNAYDSATGSGVDSGIEQSPRSESSESGHETVSSTEKRRSRSQRHRHQVLLARECQRIDNHGRQLMKVLLSNNGKSHVPGASTKQPVSSPNVSHGGDGFVMTTKTSKSFASSSMPVHEETPWSFESTLSSSARCRPEVPQNAMESGRAQGVSVVVKPHENPDGFARSNNSTIIDASLSRDVRLAGDHISSRLANFATVSSDRKILSIGTDLVSTHLATRATMSSLKSKVAVESASTVSSNVVSAGTLVVLGQVGVVSSPGFVIAKKLSKASSGSSGKVNSDSLDYNGVETIVQKAQGTSAVQLSSPSLSLQTSGSASTLFKNGTEAINTPATTTLGTVSTLATLVALGLATTVAVFRHAETAAMVLAICLLASVFCDTRSVIPESGKGFMNISLGASMWNFWSDMILKIDCKRQCVSNEKNNGLFGAVGEMAKKFSSRILI